MNTLTRRQSLAIAPFIGFAVIGAAGRVRAATAVCDDEPTSANDEGPFFKPSSPERASLLEPGVTGPKLILSGKVLSTGCAPIADAVLDFWHCDTQGRYDNTGFLLRGHIRTERDGAFRLETIMPGQYPGRTRHIHVKAAAPSGRLLTTQLYFPDEARNARDGLFRPDLVMAMSDGGAAGAFDFVLKTA